MFRPQQPAEFCVASYNKKHMSNLVVGTIISDDIIICDRFFHFTQSQRLTLMWFTKNVGIFLNYE